MWQRNVAPHHEQSETSFRVTRTGQSCLRSLDCEFGLWTMIPGLDSRRSLLYSEKSRFVSKRARDFGLCIGCLEPGRYISIVVAVVRWHTGSPCFLIRAALCDHSYISMKSFRLLTTQSEIGMASREMPHRVVCSWKLFLTQIRLSAVKPRSPGTKRRRCFLRLIAIQDV